MCLSVEKLGHGQDVVLTGSKDHHIKVIIIVDISITVEYLLSLHFIWFLMFKSSWFPVRLTKNSESLTKINKTSIFLKRFVKRRSSFFEQK